MGHASHENRLRCRITRLRRRSTRLQPGAERNALLKQADDDEIALALIQWMKSPCNRRSPGQLIAIRRYRLV